MLGSYLSQQKILNTLQSLGLSSLDAEVYLFLGKKGPKKAGELVQSLHIPKQQLYAILKNLQSKGIINATLEHPARFSAEPFEKVLDLFLKAKIEEVQLIQGNKNEILTDWQSIKIDEVKDKPTTFKVLEGDNYIYPKLKQMLEEAKTQLLIVFRLSELIRINQNGVLDELIFGGSISSIKIRVLTEIFPENRKIMKAIFRKQSNILEVRVPDFGLKLPNSQVIRDDDEVAFMLDLQNRDKQHSKCLWTNCKALVQSFSSVFEESWQSATDIHKKIAEIETGKPSSKTSIIKDPYEAQKKYVEKIRSSQKSVYMMTSSNGLIECWRDQNQKNSWIKKGIYVRIMAPITNENIEATRHLLEICEVKHIPEGFIATAIIDKQHLFQFSAHLSGKESSKSLPFFENTIYSDDTTYIEKMENMLSDIWENAQSPPLFKPGIKQSIPKGIVPNVFSQYRTEFKKILGLSYEEEPKQGKITEQDVIKKIATAERFQTKDPKKDILRIYCTMGTAIVYPKKNLKLPNLFFQISHANSNSSFGEANSLTISIQTNIADEQSYLQTAFITDNPEGYKFRKAMLKNHYNTEAVYLLNKNELTVQTSANTLFAGWTVPIPLLSNKYILPPANLIFKGTGKATTYCTELKGLLNRRLTYEFNSLEAFVTFMLPSSSYYSPATDGLFYRECIITSYPPTK